MIRDIWRSRAAVFAAPILVLAAFFLDRMAVGPEYYGLARLAQASSVVAIVTPLCAGLAAWEGWRLRAAGPSVNVASRTQLAIAARALTPIWLLAAAAFCLATALMLASGPSLEPAHFRVLLLPAAITVAHTALAYAAGRTLPAVFAIPAVVIGSWLWLVYPISLEPLWLRHLSGYLLECCDTGTVLASGAFVAPLIVSLGMLAAAWILLQRGSPAARLLAALASIAVAVGVSIPLVSDLGSEPTAPRALADLACADSSPRVCLWPEHRSAAALVHTRAALISRQLRDAGITVPNEVSEGRRSEVAWAIGVVPHPSTPAVDTTLVEGLIPPFPSCAHGAGRYPGIRAYWPVALWLARRTGASTDVLRFNLTGSDRREVAAVLRRPQAQQITWYRANRRALANCGTEPKPVAAL